MNTQKDGFLYAYSVEEIPGKGLGVIAGEAIKQGSLVWRHVPGQYAVYNEEMFTALIANMTREETIYELTHCFGLAEFPNCVIRVFDAGVLFNHSSDHTLATNNAAVIEPPFDPGSPRYVEEVTEALLSDRYAMIATRDIAVGEEFTNNYAMEVGDPPFFEALYDQYDIDDSYMDEEG